MDETINKLQDTIKNYLKAFCVFHDLNEDMQNHLMKLVDSAFEDGMKSTKC